jgi:hypothetical protein
MIEIFKIIKLASLWEIGGLVIRWQNLEGYCQVIWLL